MSSSTPKKRVDDDDKEKHHHRSSRSSNSSQDTSRERPSRSTRFSSQPDIPPIGNTSQRAEVQAADVVVPKQSIVGKRKMGGRVLKTGVLTADKRPKTQGSESVALGNGSETTSPKDSSSVYLEEMKKYSEHLCTEERHARPLVK